MRIVISYLVRLTLTPVLSGRIHRNITIPVLSTRQHRTLEFESMFSLLKVEYLFGVII